MQLTPRQGTALAVVLASMRTDWPEQSILTFMQTHAESLPFRDFTEFAMAAVSTAANPAAKTPGMILGARVKPGADGGTTAMLGRCADHRAQSAESCVWCESEIKAGQRPRAMKGLHWELTEPGAVPWPAPAASPAAPSYIPTPSAPTWMDRSVGKDD